MVGGRWKVNKDLLIRLVDKDSDEKPTRTLPASVRRTGGAPFRAASECKPLPVHGTLSQHERARIGTVEWDPTKVDNAELHEYLAVLQKGSDVAEEDGMDIDKDSDDENEGNGDDDEEEKEPIPTDIGLRHLHSCSYSVAIARQGLERLVEEIEVDELVLSRHQAVCRRNREYGKAFDECAVQ